MTTLYAPTPAPMAPTPPPLARLARIELRKAVDTRAGRWLLVLIGLVAVTGAAITAVTDPVSNHNLSHVLSDTSQLVAILLPVLGILLVTSEWSQHTALTTFTLVPRRSRIIGAKVAAGVLLAAAATVMCVAVTAVVLIAADHGQAGLWQGAGRAIGYAFVFQILNLLLGSASGCCSTAPRSPSWCTSRRRPRGPSSPARSVPWPARAGGSTRPRPGITWPAGR